jgi:hypothetical protein
MFWTHSFVCQKRLSATPEEIAQSILDVARWPEFNGFGPIPGIQHAEFEHRTEAVVGSRIRVVNRDGSTHVEEIILWDPPRRLWIKLHQFSPPVSRLATSFDEMWDFQPSKNATLVTRIFALHPKAWWAWLPLKIVAYFLRRAIDRHLIQIDRTYSATRSRSS